MTTARQRARDAFAAGVRAADPATALDKALATHPLPEAGHIHLISIGKAARAMAEAALAHLPTPRIAAAIVVTNPENAAPLAGCAVHAAAHPVPDAAGLAAAEAVEVVLDAAGEGDTVLALISGGASALLPAPIPGVSLADKIAVNRALLGAGLDIVDMNLVRQSLSRLKGGGMLRRAAPARVRSYILSDVLGDDLRAVASGPTVGPIGTPAQARSLLTEAGLWPGLPGSVREALSAPATPLPALPPTEAHLIGSNRHALRAMAEAAGARISPGDLVGDVQDAAKRILAEAASLPPGAALAFGGETTVRLTGQGRGGRNQELALRVAVEAGQAGLSAPWVFLSGGTDGRDGPTDAAGGLVDDGTLSRLSAAGIDAAEVLADNDSHPALAAAGDLLVTRATGTNVADLQLFLR